MIRRILAAYGRAVDAVDRVIDAGAALLLGVVVLLTGAEIIGRNVFKYSSPEMVDITLALAILIYLLGYFVLLNRDQDVTMDFLYRRLGRRSRRVVDALTTLGILVFFLLLTEKSWLLVKLGMNSLHPVFPVPHGVVALPVLVASAICVLAALRRALDALRHLVDDDAPPWERRP